MGGIVGEVPLALQYQSKAASVPNGKQTAEQWERRARKLARIQVQVGWKNACFHA
jgi:hypothetical protein